MDTETPSQPQAASAAPASSDNVITLAEPIVRASGHTIDTLTLRKPTAGELRGLKVDDLFNADVTAIITLLPRICEPRIIPQEAERLATEDLFELAGAVRGFFMTAAMKEHVRRMAGA